MGNILGRKKTAKVMKINGETIKFKTPVQAGEVVKNDPGHVLLDSEAVKHFGIRAKPLDRWQELEPKRLYFLVQLPEPAHGETRPEPRRVRSVIHMSAKDRLESLMLSRRSASDLMITRPREIVPEEAAESGRAAAAVAMRVKVRLPKADVEKLMMESKDEAEAVEKIVAFYMVSNNGSGGVGNPPKMEEGAAAMHRQRHVQWKDGLVEGREFYHAEESEFPARLAKGRSNS